MSAINFPDSPVEGDTYTVNGKTWTFLGSTWVVVSPNIVPAFTQANLSNTLTVANTLSNGFVIIRSSQRSKLNFIPASSNVRINVTDDSAGDRINVEIETFGSGGGGSGTGMNLTAGNTLANGFYFTRTTALANINFIDEALMSWNVDVDSTNFRINIAPTLSRAPFAVANNANLYANLAFRAANAVYDFANTININVAATMLVANNANVYANLAFRAANAVYDFANTININVAATMLVANNANVYANLAFRAANAAYDFANAINIKVDTTGNAISNVANTYSNGYVVAQSSRGTLNFMADTTDIKIRIQDNATHGLTNVRFDAPGIGAAYTLANAANLLANQLSAVAQTYSNGYVLQMSTRGTLNFMADTTDIKILVHDNATHGLVNVRFDAPGIGAAYTQANAAKTEADAVFGVANAHNGALTQMNTAIFAVANNANLYANLAFRAANAAYDFANTININVAATMLVANNANVYANLAFRAANAAYDFANVININVAATMLMANFANLLANSLSNVAQTYSNGYVVLQSSRGTLNFMADTTDIKIRVQDNATHGLTNVRFDAPGIGLAYAQSNIAMLTASTAYDKANLANQLANGAFLQANTSNLVATGNTMANGYFTVRGNRTRLNFIPGTNMTVTVDDDAAGDRINISLSAAVAGATDLNVTFGNTLANGFYFTRSPAYANVNLIDDTLMNWNISSDATNFRINVYPILSRAPFDTANTANLYANLAFRAANAVYDFANVMNINVAATMLVANNANVYANLAFRAANAVYDFANTININVAATMLVANNANVYANLAFRAANAAYDFANAINIKVDTTGNAISNVANTYSNGYVVAQSSRGTLNFMADTTDLKIRIQDNTTHGLTNVRFDAPGIGLAFNLANAANILANQVSAVAQTYSNGYVIQMSTRGTLNFMADTTDIKILVHDNATHGLVNVRFDAPGIGAAYTQANAAKTEADAVFGVANVHNAAMAQMNSAIFGVANNANLYANLAFRAANAVYDFANTININVAATMLVANNANVYANLAFRAANAVYDFANVININVAATMLMANFANLLANSLSNVAQTYSNGYVVLQSSRGTLNFMADTTDIKIRVQDNATHGLTNVRFDLPGLGLAYAQSNIAMLTASTAYDKANLANQLANGAFLQANAANLLAVGNTLGNGFFFQRASRSKLNFIDSTSVTWNVADDSAGDRINVTIALSQAAGSDKNTMVGNTTAAGTYTNRAGPYSNINFLDDALLTWNINDDTTSFRANVYAIVDRAPFNTANTANLYANLAFRAANAVYDFANTININVAATMLVANVANARANLAQMASNAAFAVANLALPAAGGIITGDLRIDGMLRSNLTGNIVNILSNGVGTNTGYLRVNTGNVHFYATPSFEMWQLWSNAAVTYNAAVINVKATGSAGESAYFGVFNDGQQVFKIYRGSTGGDTIVKLQGPLAGAGPRFQVAADGDAAGRVNFGIGLDGIPGFHLGNGTNARDIAIERLDGGNIRVTDATTTHNYANLIASNITALNTVAGIDGRFTNNVFAPVAATIGAAIVSGLNVQPAIVAGYGVANNANLYANLAFMAANAVYAFANVININVAATMLMANFANILANNSSNVAQTFSNGYVVQISSRGTLNFMADTTDLKIRVHDNATHGLVNIRFDAPGIGAAYAQANLSNNMAVGNTIASNGYFTVRGNQTRLNFIPGANVTINVTPDVAGDRMNVTIESYSTGGAAASGPPVQVSEAEPGTTTANSLWFKSDTGALYVRYDDGTSTQWVEVGAFGIGIQREETITLALSDETSQIVAGTSKISYHFPKPFSVTAAFGSLSANSTAGNTHIDINKAGVSIFSTNITILAANAHSDVGGNQPTLGSNPTLFARGDKMNVDIDLAGTGAAGLKVHLIGYYT